MVSRGSSQIWAIAATAAQEVLRRKVLYVVVFLLVIVGVFSLAGMAVLQMAAESGEAGIATSIRTNLVSGTLGMWISAAKFLAVFLGAIALSSEVTSKTIVNVLARPIDRAAYLTGRWLGLLIFLVLFQVLGHALGLLMIMLTGVSVAPTFWFGLLESFVSIIFLSGVSLALSVVMLPIVAGGLTVFLPILSPLVQGLTDHPKWVFKGPAMAIYYLLPAHMPFNLISESLSGQLLKPRYGLYAAVIAENFLYAMVVFAVGCVLLRRRELRLR
jgi:ABC-type transport system involved in multi-copper enzyme maturation permease subunit